MRYSRSVPRLGPIVPELTRSSRAASRRGTYDRDASPSERVKLQRAELLGAVRHLAAGDQSLTVSSIAAARGLGRNTFYEHFPTVEAAVLACVEESAGVLEQTLAANLNAGAIATPSEHARTFGSSLRMFRVEHWERWALLGARGPGARDGVIRRAVEALHLLYVKAGASRAVLPPLSVAAISGAVIGLVDASAGGEHSESEVAEEFAAVLGRLFR